MTYAGGASVEGGCRRPSTRIQLICMHAFPLHNEGIGFKEDSKRWPDKPRQCCLWISQKEGYKETVMISRVI